MKHRHAFGVIIVSVAVVVLCAVLLDDEKTGESASSKSSSVRDATSEHEHETEPLPSLEEHRQPVPADGPALTGTVRSSDGSAIRDARVRWLALEIEDIEAIPAWPMADWGVPGRREVQESTDAAGSFVFEQKPAENMTFGSVLIVLHPLHHPGGLDLSADSEHGRRAEIVLEAATSISVKVVDSTGNGVAEATVHHAGKALHPVREDGTAAEIYGRFLEQQALTDRTGHVVLAPFRGEQAIWARKGESMSRPWQGPDPASVVLVLGESFTVGGTLTYPDKEEWEEGYEGERRVLVSGLIGNLWRPLACLRDVEEGAWGPIHVPLDGSIRYAVRLEGVPITPVEDVFDRPRPASHRRIDFVAERGADLYLLVQDELGTPIPTASGVVQWGPLTKPSGHVKGAARSDGVIYFGTFPPGWVAFRASAPGYGFIEGSQNVATSSRIAVTLEKGGRIAGRCLHHGQPVSDFEVIYRREGNIPIHVRQSFFDREDGTFEIESLAVDDWSIQAASPIHPAGRPVAVRVEAQRTTNVEVELPSAIRGAGRVIAADSLEPLPGARIQPHSSGGMERGPAWGPEVLAAQDGSFELDAFVLGANYLTVTADGYASTSAKANGTDEGFLDWGEVMMYRPQALELSLLGIEGLPGLSASDLRVNVDELPETTVAPDGTVRLEDIPPGDRQLFVAYPDDSWARLHLRLEPGKEWSFQHKVAGDRKLLVRVVDAEGKAYPDPVSVFLSGQEETGFVVRMRTAVGDASTWFQGVRASKVQVWVMTREGTTLATQDCVFSQESSREVVIRVGEKPFRVHVVDGEGLPITGAYVTIRSQNGAEIHGVDDTDSDGWASLHGLPSGPLLMDVGHGIAGRRFGIPIDASQEELEFVLDAKGALELKLADGDQALAGVAVRIETTGGVTLSDTKRSDAAGLVRFEPLGEGSYRLSCVRTDCWPAFVDEDLEPDEKASRTVQMRRLGDLDLTVVSKEGLPISDLAVELISSEFVTPVETWLREDKVRARAGLTTDVRGTIRVEGLPRGFYTWSIAAGNASSTGGFELKPGPSNEVRVWLP